MTEIFANEVYSRAWSTICVNYARIDILQDEQEIKRLLKEVIQCKKILGLDYFEDKKMLASLKKHHDIP